MDQLENEETKNQHGSIGTVEPPHYLRAVDERAMNENANTNASYTAMEGFTGDKPFRQREEDADDDIAGVGDEILPATSDSFPVHGEPDIAPDGVNFAFKDEGQEKPGEKPEPKVGETVGQKTRHAHSTAPGLLRRLAQEADPVARLAEARQRYVENRQLVHENLAHGSSQGIMIGRITEVALGRAAGGGSGIRRIV